MERGWEVEKGSFGGLWYRGVDQQRGLYQIKKTSILHPPSNMKQRQA
jgi:hypothetical protein